MSVTFESVQALPARAPDRECRYGDADSQRVQAWDPVNAGTRAAPVVVLVHGGCWLSDFGVEHVHPLASALAGAGYGVWAPEYRRIGEAGAGWPGTFEDVASAIDLLRETRPAGFDLDRVALVGHSAGGHLALWAAARGAFDASHPLHHPDPFLPAGAVGLAAIVDLAAYAAGSGPCQQAVVPLMGGAPADREEHYRQASPSSLPHDLPVLLLQGAADRIVGVQQARALPGAEVRVLEGAGHFDLIHPETAAFPALLGALRGLLGDA